VASTWESARFSRPVRSPIDAVNSVTLRDRDPLGTRLWEVRGNFLRQDRWLVCPILRATTVARHTRTAAWAPSAVSTVTVSRVRSVPSAPLRVLDGEPFGLPLRRPGLVVNDLVAHLLVPRRIGGDSIRRSRAGPGGGDPRHRALSGRQNGWW
jgi:hypothetical protein